MPDSQKKDGNVLQLSIEKTEEIKLAFTRNINDPNNVRATYKILDKIGQGSFGVVRRAIHKENKK